jgi:hypothetical protein
MKIALFILVVLLVIIVGTLLFFLISPFKMIIDTREGIYRLGWDRGVNARAFHFKEEWGVRLNIFGWKRDYGFEELVKKINGPSEPEKGIQKEVRKKRKKTSRFNFSIRKLKRIVRQIKVKQFQLEFDTEDVILNAYLLPVFEAIRFHSHERFRTRVNFIRKNMLRMNIQTRMINVLKAGLF